jgi:hypothetical protein
VTWIIPAEAKLHERAELPEPVRLVGLRVHDVLLVVRLMMLANPFNAVTDIVDVAGDPASTETPVGLAVML